jgi:hypothetical protein
MGSVREAGSTEYRRFSVERGYNIEGLTLAEITKRPVHR